MNFKRISLHLMEGAALMVFAHLAHSQSPALAAATQTTVPSGEKTAPANASNTSSAPQAAAVSALRLVEQEDPGRDAQGNMRIKLIDGGIKLPAKQ